MSDHLKLSEVARLEDIAFTCQFQRHIDEMNRIRSMTFELYVESIASKNGVEVGAVKDLYGVMVRRNNNRGYCLRVVDRFFSIYGDDKF